MRCYILLTFFPIYYSFSKQMRLKSIFSIYNKNDAVELDNKTKNTNRYDRFITYGLGEGYDNRINDNDSNILCNLYNNLIKNNLLKTLENNDISINTKLSLISYHQSLNEYPIRYLSNLHAGGLMDDWDFI